MSKSVGGHPCVNERLLLEECDALSIEELRGILLSEIHRSDWLREEERGMEARASRSEEQQEGEGEEERKEEETEQALCDDVQNLKTELYDLSVESEQIELLRDRLLAHPSVVASVFNDQEGGVYTEVVSSIQEAMERRDRLVTESLHLHQQLTEIRNRSSEVQVQCAELKAGNRSRWCDLKDRAVEDIKVPEDKSDEASQLEQEILRSEDENATLRSVVQAIIVASEVDWAEDVKLLDVMMHLSDSPGVNVETLDDALKYWKGKEGGVREKENTPSIIQATKKSSKKKQKLV